MPDHRSHHDILRRRLLLAGLGGLAWPLVPQAQTTAAPPAEVARAITGARLQGSGRLTFFGMHVYDARLWVNEGFQAERFGELPLAIELEYARTLYGKLIAERSLTEMKKVGEVSDAKAEAWLADMTRLFPDVGKGDRITGIQLPGGSARFYLNGQTRGSISDLAFAPLFFGIWLSPRSSEPKLRQALVGGGKLGG
jgi:hypothetical protein